MIYTKSLAFWCCLLAGALPVFAPAPVRAESALKVVFLSPDPAPDPAAPNFWHSTVDVMREAAGDLNIDLEVVYSKGNTFSYKRDGLKIIANMDPSAYLLSGYVPGATKTHLQAASRRGIKSFVFNMAIPDSDRAEVGRPRGKYKHWIGHMWPDDEQAGHDLAGALVSASAKRLAGGDVRKHHIIGLSAHNDEYAGYYRNEGLKRFAVRRKDVILGKVTFTQWEESVTKNTVREFLTEHPGTEIVWAAGDIIALWALDVMKELGYEPGGDIFAGGINWTDAGLKAVAAGDMVASFGGHFLEGVWSLLLIHDYHHGIDFRDSLSTEIPTQLQPVNAANVETYLKAVETRVWRNVDFRRFSKHYSPGLEHYNFSPDAVLR